MSDISFRHLAVHSPLSCGKYLCPILIAVIGLLAVPSVKADTPSNQSSAILVVDASAPDGTTFDVSDPTNNTSKHLFVSDSGTQARLKALNLQPGDHVTITTAVDKDGHEVLQLVSIPTARVPLPQRLFILICCAGIYLMVALGLTFGNPLKLVIGEDGHYSNSKFQMALWFSVVIITYLATVVLRGDYTHYEFLGGVGIPNNLLLLSGMSALTFAAAKGITTTKVQAATDAGIVAPKPYTNNPRFLFDLTHNDVNQLDIGDFQMIVVTLVAVGMYLALILKFLGSFELRSTISLPDVDTTVLAAFGLGQGAYLTKKAVGNVGQT